MPNLAGHLGTIHDTNFKAIQIVENGTADLQASLKWTASLLSQGTLAAIGCNAVMSDHWANSSSNVPQFFGDVTTIEQTDLTIATPLFRT